MYSSRSSQAVIQLTLLLPSTDRLTMHRNAQPFLPGLLLPWHANRPQLPLLVVATAGAAADQVANAVALRGSYL